MAARRKKKAPAPELSPAREPLTPFPTTAQLECLRVFARMTEQLGRDPTVRELSAEMGFSEMGAQGHLRQLEAKGYIETVTVTIVRGRKLTPVGKKWLKVPV